MKNFYMSIAMVCALSASAVAANTGEVQKQTLARGFYPVESAVGNINMSTAKKAKAHTRALTVDDIAGAYTLSSDPVFSDGNGGMRPATSGVTCIITAISDTQIVLQLEPFCSGYTNVKMERLVATFDADAQTIAINVEDNQNLGTVDYSDIGLQTLSFTAQRANTTTNKWETLEELVGHVNADGSIQLCSDMERFGFVYDYAGSANMPAGTYYMDAFRNAKLTIPDYFKYNAAEWETVGQATFTDDFINQLLKEEYVVSPFSTDLLRNKTDNNTYLVKNVYQHGNFAEINQVPTSEGYIVFNVADPTFVWMRPLTGCGMWQLDEDTDDIYELLPYNMEGDFIFNDKLSVADAKSALEENEYTPSSLDATTGTVKIQNILYGNTFEPFRRGWFGAANPIIMTFQSDVFKGGSGVNGIISDNENAPKRYFNLQGVEIANPEAGQIVIVRQGNETTKAVF